MIHTIELDSEFSNKLIMTAFKDVENITEIRHKVEDNSLKCCVLKRKLIFDSMQIAIAANKALLAEKYNHMITKNIYSEIIFNLNLSKNITQSLTRFGIDENESNIIVAIIAKNKNDSSVLDVLNQIKGTNIAPFPNDEVDKNRIQKIYKISDAEQNVSSFIDSVISRIATKDFISY